MVNTQWLEQLQRRVSEVLANSPAKDLDANLKAALNAFFARLDLVTREEFEQLEAKLAALERGGGPPDA